MSKNRHHGSTHEDITEHAEVQKSSNRSFGLVFAAFFAILGGYRLFFTEGSESENHMLMVFIFLGIAGLFLLIALLIPRLLAPLNQIWFRFGMLLAMIVQPVVMAGLFFLTIMPIGLLMRMVGKDLLALKRKPDQESYWIARDPAGPAPESLKNQF